MHTVGGIHWTISHAERLVTAKVVGRVSRTGFEAYVAALRSAGAAPYRKLFNVMGRQGAIRPTDLQGFGDIVDRYDDGRQVGPVAIVVDSRVGEALAQWFSANTGIDRPLQVFRSVEAAREWLDQQSPPALAAADPAPASPARP